MRILLASALVVAALPMAAAPSVTAQGTATATIAAFPPDLKHTTGVLFFGNLTAGSAPVVYSVNAASGVQANDATADFFNFTIDPNSIADVLVPQTLSVINTNDCTLTTSLGGYSGTIPASMGSTANTGIIYVGGTLNVPAYQAKYTGPGVNYTMTLSYR